ncbi:hypothetical protein Neosp_012665 [[Neocosmospora] mangrovei]
MEVAAAAIAFAQAIGMVSTGIRMFHSFQQAPTEFMDLLNQLSTLNGRAELLRRSLASLATAHSDVLVVDIDTIHNLQLQFEDISRQLNEAATSFISQSKGLDDKGRHRIPKLLWHKERSKLLGLRERARQLSSDMTDCLTAINTSQGLAELPQDLTVMDQSFMNVASQVQQGNVLAEKTHESVDRIVEQHENQCHRTSYVRTPGWLNSAMGSLFVQYNSLPMLGIKKCDTPLCKSASQSSLHLQWCFPRWLIARALVASLSWGSITDDGAALFLKVPRSMDGFLWLVTPSQDPRAFIDRFKTGEIRPTDILAQWGQNFLTVVHGARQRELEGVTHDMSENTRGILKRIAAMELEDAAPLTLIHQAIRGETTLSLDECIQMEPHHINTPDDVGFAPLHWAVWKEDIAAFQTLITASANVNQQTSHKRETPLHFACVNHNVDMVRTLVDSGASISSVDSDKWTPLHYATESIWGRQQDMDVVKILLDAHADPDCGDGAGYTPLHLLFYNNNVDSDHVTALARALIDAGADLEAKDEEDFLAGRVRDPIMWQPMTIRVVVDMVHLILGTREVNWEAGLFLDKKKELEKDGSHARMRRWVMHQRRLMQRDKLWGDYDCEEDDLLGWYEDEYNQSSPSDTDDDEHHRSDGTGSEDLETMSEGDDDGDQDEEEEEDANNDDDNNDSDGRDWSDGENSITFHDARETLE